MYIFNSSSDSLSTRASSRQIPVRMYRYRYKYR